jgi:hypothetical protein
MKFSFFKLREDIQNLEMDERAQENKIAGKLESLEHFRHLVYEMGQESCVKLWPTPTSVHKDKEIRVMNTVSILRLF